MAVCNCGKPFDDKSITCIYCRKDKKRPGRKRDPQLTEAIKIVKNSKKGETTREYVEAREYMKSKGCRIIGLRIERMD